MKSFFKTTGMFFLLIYSLTTYSQYKNGDVIRTGDFFFLKNQPKIRVEYVWDSLSIAAYHPKGDDVQTEEQYIQKNMQERSKNPEAGKKWLEKWQGNKKKLYEPAFELGMNNRAEKQIPTTFSSSYHDTQYTLILKTTYIEAEKLGYIYVTCLFVDSRDHSKVIAKVTIDRLYDDMPARTMPERLEQSYYDAGIVLVKDIIYFNKENSSKKK